MQTKRTDNTGTLLRIALLQINPGKSLDDNLTRGLSACRRAAQLGADIALFPEMWSCGYHIPQDRAAVRSLTQSSDGPFLSAFSDLARETNMAIAVTYLEAHDPLPRDSVRLFDRHGRAVLDYAKVHTCDFGDERMLDHGTDFPVTDLDTAVGRVRVGTMICYDREFPESARILMLRGAELILVPNACCLEVNRLSQLRSRAFENMTAIATANYPVPQIAQRGVLQDGVPEIGVPGCNGHSTLFDGMAFGDGPDADPETGSRDMLVAEAGSAPEIVIADLPLAKLRAYRNHETWGNAYRRPTAYSSLVSTQINPPFVRKDRKK
jgi:predicted amidohydrolase